MTSIEQWHKDKQTQTPNNHTFVDEYKISIIQRLVNKLGGMIVLVLIICCLYWYNQKYTITVGLLQWVDLILKYEYIELYIFMIEGIIEFGWVHREINGHRDDA